MVSVIKQIAVSVENTEKSMRFYRDKVGLKFLYHDKNVALFDCSGLRLMLGKNEKPERQPYGTVIYFQTDRLDEEYQRMKKAGVKTIGEPHFTAKFDNKEIWMSFFEDPDSNMFAFIEER